MIVQRREFLKPMPQKIPFQLASNQYLVMKPIGDIHFGAREFPVERFAYDLQWGLDRGAYFLGTGDYFEFTSATQRAILHELRDSPKLTLDDLAKHQVEQLWEILKPSKGRWLGLGEGNHFYEFRDGTTTDQLLAKKLGAPFLGTLSATVLGLGGKCDCYIFAHHGLGGGRRAGSGLLRLEDMAWDFPQGHIYLMGHNHTKVSEPRDPIYVSAGKAPHAYHVTKILARTGSWYRGYVAGPPLPPERAATDSRGSYIEQRMLHPTALGGLIFGIGVRQEQEAGVWVPSLHYAV